MSSKRRLMVAGLTMLLMAGLGACGGSSGADDDPWSDSNVSQDDESVDDGQVTAPTPSPSPTTVTGLRNATRHLPAQTTRATRPHVVRKCSKPTKGTRKCSSVRSGSETYTRVVRQERWCVSLDDVDGVATKDAVWYQVEKATYDKAAATDQRARIEFTPKSTGC